MYLQYNKSNYNLIMAVVREWKENDDTVYVKEVNMGNFTVTRRFYKHKNIPKDNLIGESKFYGEFGCPCANCDNVLQFYRKPDEKLATREIVALEGNIWREVVVSSFFELYRHFNKVDDNGAILFKKGEYVRMTDDILDKQ